MKIVWVKLFKKENLSNFFDKLPLAVIAGLAGFSLINIILLLINQFQTGLIWTLGLFVAVICGGIVFRFANIPYPGTTKMRQICNLLVLTGVLVWGGYNIFFTSQHVLVDRDPGIYANAASWLAERTNLQINNPDTFKDVKGVIASSAGFDVSKDRQNKIDVQGQHILPALLGSIGKFVGSKHLLHFNILFGMTALLAIYCFASLLMPPFWAMVGTAVMAASMPLIYFSRDTYTEPLTATFMFGGLALIWIAQKNKKLILWGLSGLVIGAGVLTRVDVYLSLIGVVAFFALYNVIAKKVERKERGLQTLFFAMPVVAMCFLAWLDLKLFSGYYYGNIKHLMYQEVAVLLGVFVVGIVAIWVTTKYPDTIKWVDSRTKKWRAKVGALSVLLFGLFLLSRPIWMRSTVYSGNYSDLTTFWISWYIGGTLACLGLVGLAYAIYKSMHDKSLLLLCGLFVILGTSLVYFVKPSIFPDQIWASRRMLPVIMPGIVIFGVYMLSVISGKIKLSSLRFKNTLIIIASLGLIIAPLTTSRPLLKTRNTAEYGVIPGLCANLPSNAVLIWVGAARLQAVQPTRTYCNVEAYAYSFNAADYKTVYKPNTKKLAEIAKVARSHGVIPFLGVYSDQLEDLIPINAQKYFKEVSNFNSHKLISSNINPPQYAYDTRAGMSLATIKDNGGFQVIKSFGGR